MERLCGNCSNPIVGERTTVMTKKGSEDFHPTYIECMEAEHAEKPYPYSLLARQNSIQW